MAFESLNKVQELTVLPFSEEHPLVPVKYLGNMPASKKDLRAQKQKKNEEEQEHEQEIDKEEQERDDQKDEEGQEHEKE